MVHLVVNSHILLKILAKLIKLFIHDIFHLFRVIIDIFIFP